MEQEQHMDIKQVNYMGKMKEMDQSLVATVID